MKTDQTLQFAAGLDLPIEAVTQKFALMGRTGSGKSYGATKLAESMLTIGAQVIALDVVGNWYGLRIPVSKDLSRYLIPFNILIFGGRNADVQINPKAGKIVATVIVEKNLSAVIDISEFIHSEQTRFAYDFLTTLFELRKAKPQACHIFLEEAQELVPQNLPPSSKAGDNFAARMLHAGERLLKIGRNYGIGATIITQRPQDVNKKVLNQTEVLVAFQMTGLQERKTIKEWTREKGVEDVLADELPSLQTGWALIWSPAWLKVSGMYHIKPKITADVSSTPEVGVLAEAQVKPEPIDTAQLEESIVEFTAELEANTPAALKKRISELEKEVKAFRLMDVHVREKLVEVEVPVFPEKARRAIEHFRTQMIAHVEGETELLVEKIEMHTDDAGLSQREYAELGLPPYDSMPELKAPVTDAAGPTLAEIASNPDSVKRILNRAKETWSPDFNAMHALKPSANGNTSLPEGERKILVAIAQQKDGADRAQLTVLTGYKRSTRDAYIRRLNQKGFVDFRDGKVYATPRGIVALPTDFEPLPTGEALQRYWLERLPEGEAAILDELIRWHPDSVPRANLGANDRFKRSTRDAYIQRLIAKKLVVQHGTEVQASDDLF